MTHFVPPSSGNNPRWGRDGGSTPTMGRGNYGYGYGGMPQGLPLHPFQYAHYQQQAAYGQQHYYGPHGPGVALPTPPPPPQQRGYAYVSGLGGGSRHPQAQPIINPELPAANMTNSTGGVGCEPGYNYFFPAEHTKLHVLRSPDSPPWQLPAHTSIPFYAVHAPVSTTLAELLEGLGATNRVPKKNRVAEVVQGGNGKWYKGVSFGEDSAKDMKRTLKEVGWDKSRTGLPGQKPVVYLYVTSD